MKFNEERRGQRKLRKKEGGGSGFRKGMGCGKELREATENLRGIWKHECQVRWAENREQQNEDLRAIAPARGGLRGFGAWWRWVSDHRS